MGRIAVGSARAGRGEDNWSYKDAGKMFPTSQASPVSLRSDSEESPRCEKVGQCGVFYLHTSVTVTPNSWHLWHWGSTLVFSTLTGGNPATVSHKPSMWIPLENWHHSQPDQLSRPGFSKIFWVFLGVSLLKYFQHILYLIKFPISKILSKLLKKCQMCYFIFFPFQFNPYLKEQEVKRRLEGGEGDFTLPREIRHSCISQHSKCKTRKPSVEYQHMSCLGQSIDVLYL